MALSEAIVFGAVPTGLAFDVDDVCAGHLRKVPVMLSIQRQSCHLGMGAL